MINNTAVAGEDYVAATGTLTIEPGESRSASSSISILDDSVDEDAENFIVEYVRITGILTYPRTPFYVKPILDNDPTPSLSISDATGPESIGTLDFVVSMDHPSGRRVTVNYATADVSATSGMDYGATTGVLTLAPGTTSRTIQVTVVNDGVAENDETFTVTLSGESNVLLGTSQATGTIEDLGYLPRFSTGDVTGLEDDGPLEFIVTLQSAVTHPTEVDIEARDGTAVAGTDYQLPVATLTLAAGETSRTVAVALVADSLPEETETFDIVLTNPKSSLVSSTAGSATGTILDDDVLLASEDASLVEGAGTMRFRVTRSFGGGNTGAATVEYRTADGNATSGVDYTAKGGTLSFAASDTVMTVEVEVLDDELDELDETFFLDFSGVDNAVLGASRVVGTIVDDNDTPAVVEISPASVAENGGAMFFAMTLDRPSGLRVTRQYETSSRQGEDAAQEREDYEYVGGEYTFEPGTTATRDPRAGKRRLHRRVRREVRPDAVPARRHIGEGSRDRAGNHHRRRRHAGAFRVRRAGTGERRPNAVHGHPERDQRPGRDRLVRDVGRHCTGRCRLRRGNRIADAAGRGTYGRAAGRTAGRRSGGG